MDRHSRTKELFGDDFEKIQNSNILLLGVGGVGGFCLDALWRTGVQKITVVDFDIFDVSNQNRQIGSEHTGELKVDIMKKIYKNIDTINTKITPSWTRNFDFKKFDLIIDAIDDIPVKIALAHSCSEKLISSMGSAKKIDPTLIETASVWKTYGDGLAKKIRYELKKSGFSKDFTVVFSPESPKCQELGTFIGVTGSFGLTLASLAVKKIVS